MKELTQDHLKECLYYSPISGVFTWRTRPVSHFKDYKAFGIWNKRFAGLLAGSTNKQSGYVSIHVDNKQYRAHRLVWLYMTGLWPENEIDHVNHEKDDNRWRNIRDVTRSTNQRNQLIGSVNTSGFLGVGWSVKRKKWYAHIRLDGTSKHLGYFKTRSKAINARIAANSEYGFHENHGSAAPL